MSGAGEVSGGSGAGGVSGRGEETLGPRTNARVWPRRIRLRRIKEGPTRPVLVFSMRTAQLYNSDCDMAFPIPGKRSRPARVHVTYGLRQVFCRVSLRFWFSAAVLTENHISSVFDLTVSASMAVYMRCSESTVLVALKTRKLRHPPASAWGVEAQSIEGLAMDRQRALNGADTCQSPGLVTNKPSESP